MILNVFGSSSSGNCYILHNSEEAVIIEAGVRPSTAMYRCFENDFTRIEGLFVSHHHADHAGFARMWSEAGVPVYTIEDVARRTSIHAPSLHIIKEGRWVAAGRFRVLPFPLIHYDPDGTPCPIVGFLIDHPETGRILFATDTEALARKEYTEDGTRYVPYRFTGIVHWMLEANYDDYILHLSDIPKAQKERIRQSHLSVNNAIGILRCADLSRTRDIMLLHMSERNSVNNESKITRRVRIATGKRCFLARAGLSVNFTKEINI